MLKPALLALAALFTSAAAPPERIVYPEPDPDWATTILVHNVNGLQVGPDGELDRFRALSFDSRTGRVKRIFRASDKQASRVADAVDGRGRTLLPGLIDAHGHVMGLGLSAIQLDLVATASLDDLKQRLGAYAQANPAAPWIVGRGWNQELWPDKKFPTAADLDSVVADRPVILERIDGHASVVNSAALNVAGIDSSTRDPAGGKIERDSSGRPTGLLIDAATALVDNKVPAPSAAQRDRALTKAQELLLASGITAVADMGTSLDDWYAMNRAALADSLHLRIFSYAAGSETLAAMRVTPAANFRLLDKQVPIIGVKLYADGALGSRGAWLKRPYADKPDTSGIAIADPATLRAQAENAAATGHQVAIHAIGDRANSETISIFEELARQYPGDCRWRIEHFQVADPADIQRLAPAGIIASMQPVHQTSDRLMAEKRLGTDRLAGAYAWQSVLKSGARLAFGSDFPVESPNPFPGLAAAISRQDMDGQPPGGWFPAERLTFEQALKAFTSDGAYAGFAEDRIGSLGPGKWADFILIDRDPAAIDAQELARTQVLETWIAGKKVWERPATGGAAGERGK